MRQVIAVRRRVNEEDVPEAEAGTIHRAARESALPIPVKRSRHSAERTQGITKDKEDD